MFKVSAHTSATSSSYTKKYREGKQLPVIQTKHLFENTTDREQLAYDLVKMIFPGSPPEAIKYELVQQGLLNKGKISLSLDVWQLLDKQLKELMISWQGPDIAVYILPIENGFIKNGIAYRDGICLFVSSRLSMKELHALFAHEYHHMCRRAFMEEPPTLMDSLMMEGLAEDAVESLFGSDALGYWTRNYSLAEVQSYWNSHFVPALYQKGLHHHKSFLFGDDQLSLPPCIGYCTGYRIVQAFKERCGPYSINELMHIKSEDIIDGAGFNRFH